MKIRSRLTLQYIFITAGIFIFALFFIYKQFELHVENELYTLLESKTRMTAEMVIKHEEELQPLAPINNETSYQLPSAGNTSIYNESRERVYTTNTSAPLVESTLFSQIYREGVLRFFHNEFTAFGLLFESSKSNKYFVISEDKPDFSKLDQLRNILIISFFFIIIAVASSGWFYAGYTLRPVSRIVREVEAILPANLNTRLISDNQNDELSHLSQTVNSLLDRIEQAFQGQKSFISNVSHELKNPLAAMEAQLQYALNKSRSQTEYENVLKSLHEDVHNITLTTEKLLQLAKVHSERNNIPFNAVRIDEVVYQAQEQIAKSEPDYLVKIDMTNFPEEESLLLVHGNESLLKTAILNLMENGCKFSPKNTVFVKFDFTKNKIVRIEFKNDGPLIEESERSKIFTPFYRSPVTAAQRGSGIGLPLVQSILTLHHSKIRVLSDSEEGNRFMIEIPLITQKIESITENGMHNQVIEKKLNYAAFKNVFIGFILVGSLLISGCSSKEQTIKIQNDKKSMMVIQDWYRQFLLLDRYSEGYRPPVSSRMIAYVGLAGWECLQPDYPGAISMQKYLPEIKMPVWVSPSEYNLASALNAAYYEMAILFFPHAPLDTKKSSEKIFTEITNKLSPSQIAAQETSAAYGKMVAKALFEHSMKDSIGHMAYLYNYDPNYKPSTEKGRWQPSPVDRMPALLPRWGQVKPFFIQPADIKSIAPKPFSEIRNSLFFMEAWEIYTSTKPISEEKRWIAEFWSDDFPGISFSPSIRWISIALNSIDIKKPSLAQTLEIYLKLGLALHDVTVKVWYDKYAYDLERPEGYIKRLIDPDWEPLHHTPSFPAYPSGHSAFGAASANILSFYLGDKINITDRTHEGRKEFRGDPRTYHSFKEMADENAVSRIFLGVHYRMDCEEGMRLGNIYGSQIRSIPCWSVEAKRNQ